MKLTQLPIACLLLAAAGVSAQAENIRFIDVPTHVNDGTYFVLPYEVSIDGTPQLVTCYDVFDDVNFGDSWQAQLLTLNQAAVSGFFSARPGALAKYERVAWLDAQPYSTNAEQIGLQYAIWNVFGNYRSSPASAAYDSAANAAAATGYQEFDLGQVRFIEQTGGVPGQDGTKQAFVFWLPTSGSGATNAVPEPQSFLLFILGGVLILGMRLFPRARRLLA